MFVYPRRRRRKSEAPRCPQCNARYIARSTRALATYYYPVCDCESAEPRKLARPKMRPEEMPQAIRRTLGI